MAQFLYRLGAVLAFFAVLMTAAYESKGQRRWCKASGQLLRIVNKDGKVGFIDRTGKLVIGFDTWPEKTITVGGFHEGLAPIFISTNEKTTPTVPIKGETVTGYIDETGKIVITPRFDWAFDFCQGVAYVEQGNLKGYINRQGHLIFDLDRDCSAGTNPANALRVSLCGSLLLKKYPFAQDFSEGLAAVANGTTRGAKYGFVNPRGQLVIPQIFDPKFEHHGFIIGPCQFAEGLACVGRGNRFGYIDKKGHFVIPPRFLQAEEFSEGLAYVADESGAGYIDKLGRWIIAGRDWPYPGAKFSEGLAAVYFRIKTGDLSYVDRAAYVDRTGKVVIEPRFDSAEAFVDGVARVYERRDQGDRPGGFGYIDKRGKYIWEPHSR
jgi:hypothetical protein